MKKQINLQLCAILGGGILFNYLFWMERLALNLLLYSLFILLILALDQTIEKGKKVILAALSHLIAGLLVVFNQSALTILAWYISLAVFIGFTHYQLLKSIFTTVLAFFLQLVTAPFNLGKELVNVRIGNFSLKPLLKPIKYVIIPFFAFFLFTILYSVANPVFAKYSEQTVTFISETLEKIFTFIFADLSFGRFMHIIVGILFTTALLLGFKYSGLENLEAKGNENLIRNRKSKKERSVLYDLLDIFAGMWLRKKMALKNENIIGIISLVALNLLLLSLNAIDISTLWLGNLNSIAGVNLSIELHEGTNALIISIVMAMFIILYFFSGNLNFYSKNKTLRLLAYTWIVQNAFLTLSVLLRDFNYIEMYGLTHKRIGVLVFILLCIVGLSTVYLKVAKQKTFFYLYKTNSLIWYILLLAFGFVNWDVFIVNYNLNNKQTVALDLDHLLDMSDKTLPLLDQNRELLRKYVPNSSYANGYSIAPSAKVDTTGVIANTNPIDTVQLNIENKKKQIENFDNDLNRRIVKFNQRYEETSWLSWNFRDWQTRQYLMRRNK